MELKLINNNSDELIIFFTGWGCDYKQFEFLNSNSNILIFYDYSSLDFNFDFTSYKKFYLIAFSAGVFIASLINLPKLTKKIAINGNPLLFDAYFGLTEKIQNEFSSITLKNITEFRKNYLVLNDKELNLINKYQPNRSLENCFSELNQLKKYYLKPFEPLKYDLIWLSENDKIFDINKQKEYYKNLKINIIPNSAHFPFFKFKKIEEILEI